MSSELDLRGLHRVHDPEPAFVERLRLRLEAAATGEIDVGWDVDAVEAALDPSVDAARSLRHRFAVPVAAAFIVAAAVGGVLWARSDDADRTVHVGDPAVSTTTAAALGPAENGWIALDSDGDIYLVRPGEGPRRLEVAGIGYGRRCVSHVVSGRNAAVVRPLDRFVGHRVERRRARDRPGRPRRRDRRPDRHRARWLPRPRRLRPPPVRDLGTRRPVGRIRGQR